MSDIPSNWQKIPLLNLCDRIVDGSHNPPKATEIGKPMLSARNIQHRKILFDEYRYISEEAFLIEHQRTQVKSNDVLLTIVGTIGRVAIVQEDTPKLSLQRSVAVLKPNDAITPRFLAYALESPRIQKHFIDNAKGTAQKGIYLKALGSLDVEVAPKSEQKRIADKLDAVLARVDACRDRLDRIPAIFKRFRQSVLSAATSGKLTEECRSISGFKGWDECTLKEICLSVTDGDHQAPPQTESGVPFITISAINDGKLRLEKASRFVPESYFENLKADRKPQLGDILFSVTGSICIPALVDIDIPFTFQRHIAILRPNQTKVSSKYLFLVLGSDCIGQQGAAAATGTAQLTVPLTALRGFRLCLPPTDEQTEIVRRVESLFAYADRLEARYKTARAQVEKLTPALLAKAFRGELVPQDPNDEPASELLARIAATKPKNEPTKRSGRKAKASISVAVSKTNES